MARYPNRMPACKNPLPLLKRDGFIECCCGLKLSSLELAKFEKLLCHHPRQHRLVPRVVAKGGSSLRRQSWVQDVVPFDRLAPYADHTPRGSVPALRWF